MKKTNLTNLLLSLILVLTIIFTNNVSVPTCSREAIGNAHLYSEKSVYSGITIE